MGRPKGSKNKSKTDVAEIPNIKDIDLSSDNLPSQVKMSPEDFSEVLYQTFGFAPENGIFELSGEKLSFNNRFRYSKTCRRCSWRTCWG